MKRKYLLYIIILLFMLFWCNRSIIAIEEIYYIDEFEEQKEGAKCIIPSDIIDEFFLDPVLSEVEYQLFYEGKGKIFAEGNTGKFFIRT